MTTEEVGVGQDAVCSGAPSSGFLSGDLATNTSRPLLSAPFSWVSLTFLSLLRGQRKVVCPCAQEIAARALGVAGAVALWLRSSLSFACMALSSACPPRNMGQVCHTRYGGNWGHSRFSSQKQK